MEPSLSSDQSQHRSARALQDPPDVASLRPIPATRADGPLYREHEYRSGSPGGGCSWFSSWVPPERPAGRFDLVHPEGTCYFGETEAVAVRERCGRLVAAHLPLPASFLQGRVVSTVQMAIGPLADLVDPEVWTVGVTAELHAGNDYELTGRWARQFRAAGFDGLRYAPRFTPGGEYAVAAFGPAGAVPVGRVLRTEPVAAVAARLGVQVEVTPAIDEVVLADESDIDEEPS